MSDYSVGYLFDGIHGFGLGLSEVGAYRAAFTVEVDPFPRGILERRVAGATHLRDVADVVDPPKVDLLTGGFPCQDLSLAGKGAGIHGARSGLWSEYARLIELVAPPVVLIENVPALLRRGFEIVVANLVELGYSVEWDCLPAAAFGAPHLRDRVFAVAHRAPQPMVYGEAVPALFPTAWRDLPTRDDGWQTWPRAGFVSGKELVDLEPIAPLTVVKAGATRLPTPAARDWKDTGNGRMGRGQLPEAVRAGRLLPTPQASDGSGGRIDRELGGTRPSGAKRSITLATAVAHERRLLPTPMTTDAKGSRRSTARAPHWRGSMGDTLLDRALRDADPAVDAAAAAMEAHTAAAARGEVDQVPDHPALWPTPKASASGPDYARAGRDGSGGDDLATAVARVETGQLNPDWVEWLMGFPVGWTNPAVTGEELVAWPWHEGEPPDVPRTARDVPLRRERLTALGNALVPAVAAWLGARVLPLFEVDR